MKDSEVHLENCLLIHTYSPSPMYYNMVSLLVRIIASRTGGQNINSPLMTYFINFNKTSEYSEIYHELLTSEHFPLYNYRSSTLPCISWNIGRLLRQCTVRSEQQTLGSQTPLYSQTLLIQQQARCDSQTSLTQRDL